MDSPFLRPDSSSYPEIFTDGTIHLLGAHGIDRFSVRGLARWMGVVPATVLGDYSRARVLEIVIICFEQRWLAWSRSEPLYGPSPTTVPLRLPATEDEHLGVRVLGSLQLLAEAERLRGNPAPNAHLERLRKEERELLRQRLGLLAERHGAPAPNENVLTATMALITGLRLALADPGSTLESSEALALLTEQVGRLFDDAVRGGSQFVS